MKGIKISFNLKEMPSYGISYSEGVKSFEFEAFDAQLSLSLRYDFNRLPLTLYADVNEGDLIEAIILPHRIELCVNGQLIDEEWPAGNSLFKKGGIINSNLEITLSDYENKTADLPSVISEFTDAEGWNPGNGVFVGDCMPYERDGEFHVLYLKDRHHHKSKWGLGAHQWEHISTRDFKTWQIHPTAVPITDPQEASICTGSHIRKDNVEYLYYTVRRPGWKPAPISRSISADGYHFTKDKDFGFILSDNFRKGGARDPKVFLGDDGLYHMFLTTSLAKNDLGCLAHYLSKDAEFWYEAKEPIYVSRDKTQPECPDYFKYKGKYYLIFSLHGKARYMISDKPFEGFTEPENSEIPCQNVPKAAIYNEKIIFVGFNSIGGYAGTMTFKAATALEDGRLIFEDL